MLNARAIAVQGFGYGARMEAARGFGIAIANADPYGSGSGDDDKKKRFIRRQNEALLMFVSAMASTGAFNG